MCAELPELSGEDIQRMVTEKIEEYAALNFLERFAIYMGKAQLLEFGLKHVLARDYDIPIEEMEKWTLGKTKNELERVGVRPDFIAFLNGVVNHRNHIAHEMLLDNAMTRSIANFSPRKFEGNLFRGTYELEQIMVLYDWCEEHKGWAAPATGT